MWNPFSLFKKSRLLSASDKQLLVQAIQSAEKTTSGEIRVYLESHLNKKEALERAQHIFIKNKMHETKQRNGVLLYVALEDKKLAIYGDQGIHEKVGGGQESADAGEVLKQLEEEMWEASEKLEYERAALLRDQIEDWKRTHQLGGGESTVKKGGSVSVRYSGPKKVSAKSRLNKSK